MKKNNKTKNILAIETTSEICGVAVLNGGIVYDNNINNGFNHSITLFNNIDDGLKKSKLDMSNIDEIRVSNGPGSFTGIRIGVAAALGLSERYNTKIKYVDTLDSLAYNVINKQDVIISMIDAKCDRVYISLYLSKSFKRVCNDFIINVNELCDNLNAKFKNKNISFALVGSGAVNYSSIFKDKLDIDYKIFKKESQLKASSLIFVEGKDNLIPDINYLLSSKAEKERNGNS